jgi:CRP-like cAMP-binding protein
MRTKKSVKSKQKQPSRHARAALPARRRDRLSAQFERDFPDWRPRLPRSGIVQRTGATRMSARQSEKLAKRVALHPFLSGMKPKQLALLTDCAVPTHFEMGQVILREGEFANQSYLIESGKVVLESAAGSGRPVIIDTIGPGDLLGWSWMFPPYTWHFTARAIEPTEALFFYGTILREYCEKDHSLGYELFKRMDAVMIKRLQAARERMLAIHAKTVSLRPVVLESPFMDQERDTPGT